MTKFDSTQAKIDLVNMAKEGLITLHYRGEQVAYPEGLTDSQLQECGAVLTDKGINYLAERRTPAGV